MTTPVVASVVHRRHAPLAEIESSGLQSPWEHPGRADAIHDVLAADDRFAIADPDEWGTDPIAAVHDPGLVEFLVAGVGRLSDPSSRHPRRGARRVRQRRPPRRHRADTRRTARGRRTRTVVLRDHHAAHRRDLRGGPRCRRRRAERRRSWSLDGADHAYGLCRPPGHHAPAALYGGYCFFNNAAVAAHHVASTTGTRVTVLDVDYHHGNGTQQIFYGRDDVQYVSLHGDPVRAYPYLTGFADEVGTGRGRGANLNFPLAARHSTTTATSPRWATACRRDRRVRSRRSSWCRSASTRTTPTRSRTSA